MAKKAGDTIIANVYDENDNLIPVKGSSETVYRKDQLKYSMMEYFTMLEEGNYSEKEKDLGKAAKDYCTAAQICFGYKATGLSVSDAVKAVSAANLDAYVSEREGTLPTDVKINGISAML